MLDVNRAVADLRRGSFVIIESAGEIALTQAAEAVTPESLALLGRSGGQPRLALTANRARVLDFPTSKAAVVLLPLGASINADTVRSLVDPTWQLGRKVPLLPQPIAIQDAADDSCASAAIRLSKIAEMLPAAVTAPLGPGSRARLTGDAANDNVQHLQAEAFAK
jgi:GTP cyclohydrolase II